jgi:twitching motility two-component system response regulator PilH
MNEETDTRRTILVVDDDTSLLATLSDFLTYEGFHVVTAESGEQALVKLRRKKPDVIILDMSMPGMGGVGFLDRITAPDGSTRHPVLVLTARASMAEYFANRQIEGFIAKPCDPADLLIEVNRVIFAHSAQPSTPLRQAVNSRRALLGESDFDLHARLRDELIRAGFQVDGAHKGPQALELAVFSKPDVAVLRLELDDMSADEILRTLRRLPGSQALPVVVYGIDAPGARIEHVAQLDINSAQLVEDLSVDRIVNAALAAVAAR